MTPQQMQMLYQRMAQQMAARQMARMRPPAAPARRPAARPIATAAYRPGPQPMPPVPPPASAAPSQAPLPVAPSSGDLERDAVRAAMERSDPARAAATDWSTWGKPVAPPQFSLEEFDRRANELNRAGIGMDMVTGRLIGNPTPQGFTAQTGIYVAPGSTWDPYSVPGPPRGYIDGQPYLG